MKSMCTRFYIAHFPELQQWQVRFALPIWLQWLNRTSTVKILYSLCYGKICVNNTAALFLHLIISSGIITPILKARSEQAINTQYSPAVVKSLTLQGCIELKKCGIWSILFLLCWRERLQMIFVRYIIVCHWYCLWVP